MKKHTHVKRDVGLAAVFGAFALAFMATGYSSIELNQQAVSTLNAQLVAVESADADYDGIPDAMDGTPYGPRMATESES